MFGPKLRSPEAIQKRRRMRLIMGSIGILVLLFLFGILVWITRLPSLQITDSVIAGARAVQPEAIQKEVLVQLAGNRLGLFPRTNTFLYPEGDLHDGLLETFPRIKTVDIGRDGLQILSVDITERMPFALWC